MASMEIGADHYRGGNAAVPRSRIVTDSIRLVTESLCATVVVLLLLPALVIIAAAIKLHDGGSAFYVQQRLGRNGELFPFLKFRTMNPGADEQRSEILGLPDDDMVERYRTDPRITPVGRFLRRWSLDELPQLINVMRGDMALVGPRPILPEELILLDERAMERHTCRPGLTGLWQVSGRKETTWDERMELDLRYVRQRSFRTDLWIVRRTVTVVFRGDGAY